MNCFFICIWKQTNAFVCTGSSKCICKKTTTVFAFAYAQTNAFAIHDINNQYEINCVRSESVPSNKFATLDENVAYTVSQTGYVLTAAFQLWRTYMLLCCGAY